MTMAEREQELRLLSERLLIAMVPNMNMDGLGRESAAESRRALGRLAVDLADALLCELEEGEA